MIEARKGRFSWPVAFQGFTAVKINRVVFTLTSVILQFLNSLASPNTFFTVMLLPSAFA